MMKKARLMYLLVAVLLIVGLPNSGSAASVLIGFEDFGSVGITGPTVTNQYSDVTFSSTSGYRNIVSTQLGIGFGYNFLCTASGSIDCMHETILNFTNPVYNLKFWEAGSNSTGNVAQVDVFVGGSLSATQNILGTAQFNTPSLVDLSAFSNVTSIRIYNITDAGGLGWDNFGFDTTSSSVPEPSTLLLLGSGLVGLVGYGRRRMKK